MVNMTKKVTDFTCKLNQMMKSHKQLQTKNLEKEIKDIENASNLVYEKAKREAQTKCNGKESEIRAELSKETGGRFDSAELAARKQKILNDYTSKEWNEVKNLYYQLQEKDSKLIQQIRSDAINSFSKKEVSVEQERKKINDVLQAISRNFSKMSSQEKMTERNKMDQLIDEAMVRISKIFE
jgi:hypothetical protein